MKRLFAIGLAAATVCNTFAEWLYSGSTLTECDSSGTPLAEGGWVFTITQKSVNEEGVYSIKIKSSVVGASSELDLSTPILGTPAIITGLANSCFNGNSVLTRLKLPSTLLVIDSYAFKETTNLVHIEPFLPDGVTYIGANAFEKAGVTNALRIGYGGANVTLYNTSCFTGAAITEADLGPGITALTKYCFQNCANLTKVKLPSTLTSIAQQVFMNCTSLVSVEPFLPDSVKSVGEKAFYDGPKVANPLRIGYSGAATTIGAYAFYGNDIPSVDIGEGVSTIPKYAFQSNVNLKRVKLPETLTSIGTQGFAYCSSLETIEPFFPPSLTSVGNRAFQYCSAIASPLTIGGNKDSTYSYTEVFFRASCTGVPSITIGEGITSLSYSYFLSNLSEAREIKFLCDRPTIGSSAFNRNSKTGALKCRVYLPTKLPGWSEFLEDTVVPWAEVSEADKAVYFENFGENAHIPLGILKESNSSMGALRDQWLFNINVGQANGLTIFLR